MIVMAIIRNLSSDNGRRRAITAGAGGATGRAWGLWASGSGWGAGRVIMVVCGRIFNRDHPNRILARHLEFLASAWG
jgi:hypothetical protein